MIYRNYESMHTKVAGNPKLRTMYDLIIGCLAIAKLDQAASSQLLRREFSATKALSSCPVNPADFFP
jgi:hypothetical protein